MKKLNVIAVEYEDDGVFDSCVYLDNQLYLYNNEEHYYPEYFKNFNDLSYRIKIKQYEWTDFFINEGDIIQRGNEELLEQFNNEQDLKANDMLLQEIQRIKDAIKDEERAKEEIKHLIERGIYVNNEFIRPIRKLNSTTESFSYTLERLFYKVNKLIYSSNKNIIKELDQDFNNKDFHNHLLTLVNKGMCEPELDSATKELIVRTRIDGFYYIVDLIKSETKKFSDLKSYNKLFINHLFGKLFLLEKYQYIDLDLIRGGNIR